MKIIFFIMGICCATSILSQNTFIPYGSKWKYLDNGTVPSSTWNASAFNDAAWLAGFAQLGYGDGDEATVLSYGPNPSAKYITTYFRKIVNIANLASYTNFTLNIKRDDGAVVYVNRIERFRTNMPTSAITNKVKAASDAADDGNTPQTVTIAKSAFVEGNNIIAVEIHQSSSSSSDISFDLELKGNTVAPPTAVLTRGPYLNSALQNSIVIRWRTDIATDSWVGYGELAGTLTSFASNNTVSTEHSVTVTGLSTNKLYYYNIGSTGQVLQGDANNYFKTMPLASSVQKMRFLAMGDMGDNSANQVNVRNAYLTFKGSNYTDGWILLGDNAYNSGTDAEYQSNFFNIYQSSMTKNHVLWPAPGNHDYANSAARQADHLIPYYDIFTLPTAGQAGGVASNNEAFYSYNYGNIHFVALDSYGWETGNTRLYDTLGPQIVWLKQDLAANIKPWTIVYFHHPPYTKGSHNSDTEPELINMRQRVVRILERYKVDMVMNGHSHSYERSYLLNGHYDVETTFNPALHALSTSSAKYDGTANSCIYIKNPTDLSNGIVYAVVGSAGQLGGTNAGYPHNAMYYSDVTNGGALYFEVENNRLDAQWICGDGVVRDKFTIMKNVNKTTNITVASGVIVKLKASWIGNYGWSTGATTQQINVSSTKDTIFTVTDNAGCITDVFNITISPIGPKTNIANDIKIESFSIYPTIVKKGQPVNLQINDNTPYEINILNSAGQLVQQNSFLRHITIRTEQLKNGTYFIRFHGKNNKRKNDL